MRIENWNCGTVLRRSGQLFDCYYLVSNNQNSLQPKNGKKKLNKSFINAFIYCKFASLCSDVAFTFHERIPAREGHSWMIEHSTNDDRTQWQPTTTTIVIGHTFENLFCSEFFIKKFLFIGYRILHRPEKCEYWFLSLRRTNSEIDCETILSDFLAIHPKPHSVSYLLIVR